MAGDERAGKAPRGRTRRGVNAPLKAPFSASPSGAEGAGFMKGVVQILLVGAAASVFVFGLWASQSGSNTTSRPPMSEVASTLPSPGYLRAAAQSGSNMFVKTTSRPPMSEVASTLPSPGYLSTAATGPPQRRTGKPSVAVCIGGQARTLLNIPEVHKNIKEMFADALGPDGVMMAALFDDLDLESETWVGIRDNLGIHPDNVILYSTPPDILKSYCREKRLAMNYSMCNSFIACADVVERYEAAMGYRLEWIVRIRPDMVHENPLPPLSQWPARPSVPTVYVPGGGTLERNKKAKRKVCVTDTFAIVHRDAVDPYFREFPRAFKSGCKELNMKADSECILGESLTRSRVALPACSMAYVKMLKFYGEIYGGCGSKSMSDCTAVCDAAAERGVYEFKEGQEGRRGCDYISGRIDSTGNHHDRATFAERLFGAPETAICCND